MLEITPAWKSAFPGAHVGVLAMRNASNPTHHIELENIMPSKIPALISGLSTLIILILIAVLSVFTQMLVLNGASESQGFNATSISLICQSVGLFPAVILARWLTNLLITKFNWNNILAILVAMFAGITLGGFTSLLAVVLSIPLAGIK